MSYWHWNLWKQDCRDSLMWTVMVDTRLRIYQEFAWLLVSEGCQELRRAASQMAWCDAKSPWAPVTTAVLDGWQRSWTSLVSSMLDMRFFCVFKDLFLLTTVCAETSLPSIQGFLLCDKLSGRFFDNWSLILLERLWHYNFLFQPGTKQILDSAISVQNSAFISAWF